jgi:ABC-type Fe3+ transport system permease subunit
MTTILPALAVAFAAFCVWLTVRIVNRRERWARWALALVVGLPVLYVASFGPACWIVAHRRQGGEFVCAFYRPLWTAIFYQDNVISHSIGWYAGLFSKGGVIQMDHDGLFHWIN